MTGVGDDVQDSGDPGHPAGRLGGPAPHGSQVPSFCLTVLDGRRVRVPGHPSRSVDVERVPIHALGRARQQQDAFYHDAVECAHILRKGPVGVLPVPDQRGGKDIGPPPEETTPLEFLVHREPSDHVWLDGEHGGDPGLGNSYHAPLAVHPDRLFVVPGKVDVEVRFLVREYRPPSTSNTPPPSGASTAMVPPCSASSDVRASGVASAARS